MEDLLVVRKMEARLPGGLTSAQLYLLLILARDHDLLVCHGLTLERRSGGAAGYASSARVLVKKGLAAYSEDQTVMSITTLGRELAAEKRKDDLNIEPTAGDLDDTQLIEQREDDQERL